MSKEIRSDYTGYLTVNVNDPNVSNLYGDKSTNWFGLLENQYLQIVDDDGVTVDRYKWQGGKYKSINRKPVESMALDKIKPKNIEQEFAIDMLMDESTTVKIMSGGYGSGKTLLTCACAMQMLLNNKADNRFERIVWIRNNIEVKDSNPIGYLKGDYNDKMMVWCLPLADHLGGIDALKQYIERGLVEVTHLGFLRGRDIKNAIIFCSEAEHLTKEHVQLLLGRVAENSILVLEGDCRQIDAKAFEQNNGLQAAIDMLKGEKLVAYVHLKESVRSETAKLADLMDKKEAATLSRKKNNDWELNSKYCIENGVCHHIVANLSEII